VSALGFAGAAAALALRWLPAANGAFDAVRPALAPPGPPPRFGLAGAAADRPDAGTTASQAVLPAAPIPGGTWRALGPAPIGPPFLARGGFYGGANSGRVTTVAVLPASGLHPGRVVGGSAGGGIWTSDDNGASWTPRSDASPNLAIGALAVDPSNANHLIAGTGEANQSADSFAGSGILVSTDGGTSWTPQNPSGVFSGKHIAQVAIDPSNPLHQFAATDGGLYSTSDGGTTWAKPTSSSYGALDGNVTAVVIDPAAPKTVFFGGNLATGGSHTVAKSTDGGSTWAPADAGISAPGSGETPLVALAIARSSPSTMYASVGSETLPVAFYKTTSRGTSWSKENGTPDYTGQAYSYDPKFSSEQGWYDNVLAVDPANSEHVIAGGIALVETKDGGASWTNVNGQPFFGPAANTIHPDQHALAFAADGTVWSGDDGGVYRYSPSGGTVANANSTLDITQFYYGFNAVGSTVLAGSQDNSSARTSSSSLSSWTGISSGDGGPSAITSNHTQTQFIEVAPFTLYMTTDAFASAPVNITPPQVAPFPGKGALFLPPQIVVPNAATPSSPTVYYGGQDLYRTTNPTASPPTWTQVTSVGSHCLLGDTCVSAIAVSATGQYVYVGFTNGAIDASTNDGLSFSPLPTAPSPEAFVTGLSVNPANPRAITASFSYARTRSKPGFPHVYQYAQTTSFPRRLQTRGGTWTNITGNLPDEAVSRVIYDNGR
jgi:hypothetical protein